jgi:peptide/nickel transport system permease protein
VTAATVAWEGAGAVVRRRVRSLAPVLSSRSARVGVGLLGLLLAVAVAGPFVAPGDGDVVSMLAARDTGPSWAHLFGTTIQGQDVLSQVLDAAPLTLALVAGSSALALLLATLCGIAAGAFGGVVDRVVGVLTGVFLVVPMLPLAIVVAGVLPQERHTAAATVLTVALASWAAEARVLRAQAMALRESEFVAAVTVVGERRFRVVFHELLPNMSGRVGAAAFFVAMQCTVVLTTLDFLASVSRGRFALGDTAGATWGSVLAQAQVQQALLTGTWWAFAFPALALVTLAAGLVLTLHGVELAADPRLRPTGPRRKRLRRPSLPSLPRPRPWEPRSPLPALRDAGAAVPRVLAVVATRLPLYAFVLWIAATLAYALPRLAWRGRVQAPPPSGPFWAGYGRFLREAATGRFGQGVPGADSTIWHSLPFSLALVGTATVVAFGIGSALGLFAAWRRGGLYDRATTTATAIAWTTPSFAVAGLAVSFLALSLHLFPVQWAYGIDQQPAWSRRFLLSALRHGELPLLVLVATGLGLWVIGMRTLATATVNDDYVLLARAKGLRERRIVFRYAGRNALLPALTAFGVAFGFAIGGVPALEAVFSYSGGGFELQQAAVGGDLPLVQGLFLAIAVAVAAVNLLVDALGVVLDPRLRTG